MRLGAEIVSWQKKLNIYKLNSATKFVMRIIDNNRHYDARRESYSWFQHEILRKEESGSRFCLTVKGVRNLHIL